MSENEMLHAISMALVEVLDMPIKDFPLINKKSKLFFDLNLDSLSFIQFIIRVEELTGLSIPDREAMCCETVEDLIKCIEKNNI